MQQRGQLSFCASSIFYQPKWWPYRIERYLPPALGRRAIAVFRRFAGPPLDPALVETFGAAEWLERLAGRVGKPKLAGRIDGWGNHRFARGLSHPIAARDPAVSWGYNDAAMETFADPRHAGRVRVLDRTIGDFRAYNAAMDTIHDRYAAFFPSSEHRIPQAHIDRDDAEYEAADIIPTGSDFAARIFAEQARDPGVKVRVRVLEYCFNGVLFAKLPPPRPGPANQPVHFLLLGQANVRKGVQLVLEAFATIPASAATLTIVGAPQVPPATFARYRDRVTYRRTVARADIPALLADTDVLLFHSCFEGAGLVLYEASAAGCALIQSRRAALAVVPATGLLLNALSPDALHAAVMTMVDDRARLNACRTAAQGEARRYHFARHRDRIADLLLSVG